MKRKPNTRVKRHALKKPRKRTRKEVTRRQAGGTASSLGQNIKRARNAKGITQLALAHAIGYTGDDAGAYISRVESDTQAPRIDTLLRIAEALGVTMCSLLAT